MVGCCLGHSKRAGEGSEPQGQLEDAPVIWCDPHFFISSFCFVFVSKDPGSLSKVESLNLLSLFLNSGFFCLTILRAGIICVTYHHS